MMRMQGEVAMPQTEQVVVLKQAQGSIEPTNRHALPEVLEVIRAVQKPIEDSHVVCIDGRPAKEPQPVRAKMAGGNTVTMFAAAAWGNWSFFTNEQKTDNPMEMYGVLVDNMDRLDIKLGGHGGKAKCGAAVAFPQICQDAIAIGDSELVAILAQRDLEGLYDPNVMSEVVGGARAFVSGKDLSIWDAEVVATTIKDKGVLEELSIANIHPEIDPDNSRAGHWEEAANGNKEQGVSNDRDRSPIQFFQYDIPEIIDEAQKLVPGDQQEFKRLVHAALLFQYATAYRLTNNMPIVD